VLPVKLVQLARRPLRCFEAIKQSTIEVVVMNKAERIFSTLFGLLLFGVGIYIVLFSYDSTLWHLIAGMLLALLGSNMFYAAYRNKQSWLSRIGPLP
jgi:putative Mn2+ efflux pump MntP